MKIAKALPFDELVISASVVLEGNMGRLMYVSDSMAKKFESLQFLLLAGGDRFQHRKIFLNSSKKTRSGRWACAIGREVVKGARNR
jgi:hypothetical protein